MSTTSSTTPIDPATAATAYTQKYTADQQALITAQTKGAAATATALGTLKSAIDAYQASLTAMAAKKSVLALSATLGNGTLGSASAAATATPGSYAFFVESLATSNQVSYGGLSDIPAAGAGTLGLGVGGANFTVDLAAADKDGNGTLTPKEIAAAINAEPHNNSLMTASVITIGGLAQLVLSSNSSGAANTIAVDASAVANGTLRTALTTPANISQITPAQDAVVWLGAQTSGTRIQQGSNTFTNVADVAITFTRAQASGDPPVTLTVGVDAATTTANAQGFVDAYNKLKKVLDTLTDPGDAQYNVAAGPFAQDSGVKVLRDQMVRALRDGAGPSLTLFGITAQRDGTLALDAGKLAAALKAHPDQLDQALGHTGLVGASGVAGSLDKYLNTWSNGVTGQLGVRQSSLTRLQASLADKQTRFEAGYVALYQRYLAQFTQLQQVQSQMSQNTDLFDALFGSASKN